MMQPRVMRMMIMKDTRATLFFMKRLTPSRKNVVEGLICTRYSFSLSVAGLKSPRSCCIENGFFLFSISLPSSAEVDSRIHNLVEDVGNEVHDDDQGCQHNGGSHDQRIVTVDDG